ncbi:MAG TPA: hypothetical protein VMV82_10725 [Candidatus Dormibacteraeota bacterium]|nr:hypothetical protein [Candidatus Dormibacteraeota bacterium]
MLTYDRGLKVLRAVYAYARQYHAWPSAADVAKAIKRHKMSAYRLLVRLQADEYVQRQEKGGPESGWRLTETACKLLKRPRPKLSDDPAPRRIRNDPKKLAWYNRRKWLAQRYAAVRLYDGLEVVEV